MQSLLESSDPVAAALLTGKLRLIWKNADTRRYHEVGQFEALSDGRYVFGYLPDVSDIPGFHPLLQFPEVGRVYVSEVLPAFFANRVMSPSRPSYGDHLKWLGLEPGAAPIEILARTGGPRATDTFHVVHSFELDDGRCEGSFFVSGTRYKGSDLSKLRRGEEFDLEDDSSNAHNPRAILLAADGTHVGWIPEWLVYDVHRFQDLGYLVRAYVEQVNLDSPPHLAVRCRLVVERPEWVDHELLSSTGASL